MSLSSSILQSYILCILLITTLLASNDLFYEADRRIIDDELYSSSEQNSWSEQDLESVSTITKIYAYSRNSEDTYTEIVYGNISTFYESGFDINKTTKMIIHGWRSSAFSNYETELRRTYQSTQDVNILAVDWSKYADNIYGFARHCVMPVGKYLANVVDWMATEGGLSEGSIHIIGHSLGAHVAGAVGEHITLGVLNRITGLDPAGPGFLISTTSGRLDTTDAQFVDVIHTCGYWAGYFNPCGHVDFYPNKGTPPQPGCYPPILVCSHLRSHEFFNESITSERFVSTPCGDWKEYSKGDCDANLTINMGEHVDTSARGLYYLRTASSYPYALGNETTLQDEED